MPFLLLSALLKIMFFVCLGLKLAEKNYGGFEIIVFMKCTNSIHDMGAPCRTTSIQDSVNLKKSLNLKRVETDFEQNYMIFLKNI